MGLCKEIKENSKGQNDFNIYLSIIFSCYDQTLISERRRGARLFLQPHVKSFCNPLGNACTKFIILEIKSHFTCGESNLY